MSLTVTLYAWWVPAWLAVGALLHMPLSYIYWRRKIKGERFWPSFFYSRYAWSRSRRAKRMALDILLSIAVWPLAAWEALR